MNTYIEFKYDQRGIIINNIRKLQYSQELKHPGTITTYKYYVISSRIKTLLTDNRYKNDSFKTVDYYRCSMQT